MPSFEALVLVIHVQGLQSSSILIFCSLITLEVHRNRSMFILATSIEALGKPEKITVEKEETSVALGGAASKRVAKRMQEPFNDWLALFSRLTTEEEKKTLLYLNKLYIYLNHFLYLSL